MGRIQESLNKSWAVLHRSTPVLYSRTQRSIRGLDRIDSITRFTGERLEERVRKELKF